MNGLDCAKCQKSRKGTYWELNEMLNENKTKKANSLLLPFGEQIDSGWDFLVLKRERAHSL